MNKPFVPIECPMMRSYVAALIDWNGRYILCKNENSSYKSPGYVIAVQVESCTVNVIDFLNKVFCCDRGTVYGHNGTKPIGVNWKPGIYRWRAQGDLLDHILDMLIDYGKVTRDKAINMAEFRKVYKQTMAYSPKKGITEEGNRLREEAYLAFIEAQSLFPINK